MDDTYRQDLFGTRAERGPWDRGFTHMEKLIHDFAVFLARDPQMFYDVLDVLQDAVQRRRDDEKYE